MDLADRFRSVAATRGRAWSSWQPPHPHPAALGAPDLAGRRDGCSPPGKLTCLSSCPGGLREGKRPGRKSSFWPCAWCLTVMIKPAAEGGGQPIRGRGVALERRVAGTGPASGGVRGEALPSEALQAPLGRTASLGLTAFFSVREVGGRGGRGRRVLGVLGVGPGSLRGVGRGGCSEPVGKCVYLSVLPLNDLCGVRSRSMPSNACAIR